MAKGDIEVSINANAAGAIKGFKQTQTAAQKANAAIGKGAKVAAAGFLAVGVGALALARGAADDQKAATTLATQLKNTTGATDKQVASVEDWITVQGKATGITDDELRPALGKLVTATGDVSKAQQLALLAQNVAIGTGKDYQSVVQALAKAQNGQVAGLARLGIQTTTTTKNTDALAAAQNNAKKAQIDYDAAVKKYGKTSDQARKAELNLSTAESKVEQARKKSSKTTKSFAQIQDELDKKFGGQSAKQADTLAGKVKILHTQLSEAGESIGYQLIPILLKLANVTLTKVLPALEKFGEFLGEHGHLTVTFGASIAGVAAAFIAAHAAIEVTKAAIEVYEGVAKGATAIHGLLSASLIVTRVQLGLLAAQQAVVTVATKAWAVGQWLLNAALSANPIGLIIVGVAALVTGFVIAYKKSDTFRAIVTGALDLVRIAAQKVGDFFVHTLPAAFGAVISWAKAHWELAGLLVGPIGLAVTEIIKHRDAIWNALKQVPRLVAASFVDLAKILTSPFRIAFDAIAGLWNATLGKIHFTIPKWVPGLSGKSFGFPEVPKLANGGIVTRPTLALIGEAGPEQVKPLNEFADEDTMYRAFSRALRNLPVLRTNDGGLTLATLVTGG